jgi:T5SS/PEP-CTERM-associated repeat protein
LPARRVELFIFVGEITMMLRTLVAARCFTLALAALIVAAAPGAVQAVTWNNSGGGNFSTGSNWTGGVAPNTLLVASFDLGGGYIVSFDSSAFSNTLSVSDNVTLLLDNHAYMVPILNFFSPDSSLTVREGHLIITSDANVGVNGGSTLTADTGGVIEIGDELFAREPLSGGDSIRVKSGGQLIVRSSTTIDDSLTAKVLLTDAGSTALFEEETIVGDVDAGSITVQNGAALTSTGTFTIAEDAGSTGSVTLSTTGADPVWNHSNGPISFGAGTGTLTLSAGAANISGTGADITLGSIDSITLSGGALNVSGAGLGNGITLNSGANLTINNSQSALDVSSTGAGSGITLSTGATYFQSGGTVTTSNFTRAGTFTQTAGTFAVDGGVFNNSAAAFNFAAGGATISFQLLNGATTTGLTALNVGNGGSATRSFDVLSGSTLSTSATSTVGLSGIGTSTLRVSGAGSTWNADNIVNVGQVTGTLVVEDGGAVTTNGNILQTGTAATGIATLTVQDGGTVSAGSVNLGLTVGSTTVATVTGDGSTLGATNVFIGGTSGSDGGTAALTIGPGAEVNVSTQTRIRTAGTLNLSGGNLNTFNFTRTGAFNFTDGTLTMTGGSFSNNSTDITLAGNGVGTNPTLVLEGGTTTSGITNLNVGSSSQQGTATINAGSTLATGAVTIASQGELNLQGGTLGLSSFTNSGTFNWQSGTVRFAGGSTASDATLTALLGTAHSLDNGKSLTGLGTLTLGGNLSVDGGAISGVTTLTNNASLTLNQGSVSIATLSNSAGKVVQVNGTTNLSATTAISNSGQLRLTSETASLSGGTVTNNAGGTISGTGVINNTLDNNGTVRATGAEHLVFAGTGNVNFLNVNLAGGTVEFTDDLFNKDGAAITGRGVFVGSSGTPGGPGLLNEGLMSFSAGTMDVHGDVDNDATGRIVTGGGGVTTFYDDVIHNGDEIRTFAGARTVFFGDQSGAGSFTGTGTVEYAGDLRPGNSPAIVSYEGDVLLNSSASLFIEIGGLNAGTEFDQVQIANTLELAGSLDVALLGGFVPAVGSTFEIITAAGGIEGEFATLAAELSALPGGRLWDIQYTPTSVILEVLSGFSADFDNDGDVDSDDLDEWQAAYGENALADADSDGDSDGRDFLEWQRQFGSGVLPLAASTAVPEPRAITLIFGIMFLWRTRR